MANLTSTLQRLTGLLLPGRPPGADGALVRERGERGVRLSGERRRGRVEGGAPVEGAVRCGYDEARITGAKLVGLCALSSFRLAALEAPVAGDGARLEGCDLEGVAVDGGQLSALEVHGCSLREADLRDTSLGALSLCDAAGARLQRVRLGRAVACDFTGAAVIDCDWSGADLRGSVFRRATFKGGSLAGALVAGADFSGADLPKAVRSSLLARGAVVRRMGRRVAAGAAGVILVLAAVLLALRPPPAISRPDAAPPDAREATGTERTRTQSSLVLVRENLKRANQVMTSNGASLRVWPTIVELQDNRFDIDGDGPGAATEPLFPQGLPDNYLTDVQGSVLPYCNDVPDQPTLSGVDADWHYCEITGRVFASAGWSGEATLNW